MVGMNIQSEQLGTLLATLLRFRDERNWARFHSPKNLAAAISIEAAEISEIFLWSTEAESYSVAQDAHAALQSELADVFIYLLYLANEVNVDLIAAATKKVQQNEMRFPVASSPDFHESHR